MGLASPGVDHGRGTAGWRPDPTRRYELRWHNGTAWTADVAVHGERFVDPAGAGGGVAAPPPDARNGLAVAALVLGLVAITLVWLPFLFAIGVAAGAAGAVIGVLALRHPVRAGRPMAVWGLCLAVLSFAGAPVGWIFTTDLIDRVTESLEPGTYEIVIDECTTDRFSITMRASITNRDDSAHRYEITVHYLVDDEVVAMDTAPLESLEPGATDDFVTISNFRVDPGDSAECTVADVSGGGGLFAP